MAARVSGRGRHPLHRLTASRSPTRRGTEDEGIEASASYEAPIEERGAPEMAEALVVLISYDLVKLTAKVGAPRAQQALAHVLSRSRERFPGASIDAEADDDRSYLQTDSGLTALCLSRCARTA